MLQKKKKTSESLLSLLIQQLGLELLNQLTLLETASVKCELSLKKTLQIKSSKLYKTSYIIFI